MFSAKLLTDFVSFRSDGHGRLSNMRANSKSRVLCQNELCVKKKPVVENPHISAIESLLEKAKERVGYGENTYQNVVDQLGRPVLSTPK